MLNLFYSLVSSLPLLHMTERPAMSYDAFLDNCSGLLNPKTFRKLQLFSLVPGFRPKAERKFDDLEELKSIASAGDAGSDAAFYEQVLALFEKGTLAYRYTEFEVALRQSAMKLRAARLGGGFAPVPAGSLRFDSEADRVVHAAYAAANPLERERILDAGRWAKLDELESRRATAFNFDTVCAYSIRIQIAEKWADRNPGHAEKNLDATANVVGTNRTEN